MTPFEERVAAVVAHLPPGTVVTYGEVAVEAGYPPGAARGVGNLLARSPDGLPWWRVVTATGRLVPGAEERQRVALAAEGVEVEGPEGGSGPRVRALAGRDRR
ncbi:MAG: MGMT family protein [Actinomycetota bacterium]|nr:MGMT family protein [Actinomycetota bacterium]